MGEIRFNGMPNRPNGQGFHIPGKSHAKGPQAPLGNLEIFGGSSPLDDILSLQNTSILLMPAEKPSPKADVAALVAQAIQQDPHGRSLSADVLTKLKNAPADPHGFEG